jgi:uncharacterized protein YkwD
MGWGKRFVAPASACALLALSPAASVAGRGACPHAGTPAISASLDEMRTAVVCLINHQRSARGLPSLTVSRKLDAMAQRWTRRMVAHNQFSHAHFVARINAVHYSWQTAEENIATGYMTPSAAVAGWMASPDHCRNILDPSIRNVGTGERPAPVSGWSSGPATWTQDFGLRMSQPPPSHDDGPAKRCPYRARR